MIRTIPASEFRGALKKALVYVKRTKKPLVITERGVPVAVLMDVDEYEDYVSASSPGFVSSIQRARNEYRKGKVFLYRDIF